MPEGRIRREGPVVPPRQPTGVGVDWLGKGALPCDPSRAGNPLSARGLRADWGPRKGPLWSLPSGPLWITF
jgi:hypothetical protein